MQLSDLSKVLGIQTDSTALPHIVQNLAYDTRTMAEGALLVLTASHMTPQMVQHIQERPPCGVIASPALISLMQHNRELWGLNVLSTLLYAHPCPHQALSVLASFLEPLMPDHVVAVTGTNGKTSVVHFARSLWEHAGQKAASIGTLGVQTTENIAGLLLDRANIASMTTPNSLDLRKILAQLASADIQNVAIEASSHGLDQYRLHNIPLKAAGFTQLSHDHLDYHQTLERYFLAKTRLFTECLEHGQTAVLNQKSLFFDRLKALCVERGCKILEYGAHPTADLRCVSYSWNGREYHVQWRFLDRTFETAWPILGDFQIMNLLCAVGLLLGSGVALDPIINALPRLCAPQGRLSYAGQAKGYGKVYVDYAHTPDGLKSVLLALRPLTSGKLRVVFGCGGDRDITKRPLMGEISQAHSDVVYVTDDNPRTEEAASIRAQVLATCPQGIDVPDRAQAIRRAIMESSAQDMILIAGKGHETSQWIGDRAFPFSDDDVVRRVHQDLQRGER